MPNASSRGSRDTNRADPPPWAGELLVRFEDWPDFKKRWNLQVADVTWLPASAGVTATVSVVETVAIDKENAQGLIGAT